MAMLSTCLMALCICVQTIYGQSGQSTIQDILRQRPELKQLLEFSRDTQSFTAFGQRDARFTLFAPTNGAFQQLSPALTRGWSGRNEQALGEREHLVQYHSIREMYTLTELRDTRKESQARDAPKLFIRSIDVGQETNVYVNGARFVGESIVAANGIVHMVDAVLYPIASKKNALALIRDSGNDSKDNRRAMKFFELLERAQYFSRSPYPYLNSDSLFVTVFVPTDISIKNILTDKREEELLQNSDAVVNLLNRHIILHKDGSSRPTEMDVTAVAHASILNDAIDGALLTGQPATFAALHGQIQPVRIANALFVTNECGMVKVMDLPRRSWSEGEDGEDEEGRYEVELPSISSSMFPVEANVTVNNGVIHFVDGLLGYIYNDAIEMLEDDEDISKFRDTVRMSPSFVDQLTVRPGNDIRESDKLTIFAPVDAAFTNMEAAGSDLSQDDERREQLLNMHMLRGVLNLVDIGNNTRKQTLDPTTTATFYVDRTGTYVEVDRIRARIVKADVCVKNGIIHYIDNLLGMPYRNLLNEIQAIDMLSDLDEAILQTPQFIEGNRNGLRNLKSILEDTDSGERTLFAPNQDAFRKLRNTDIGRQYMDTFNQRKLYYLILRHVPTGQFYIDDDLSGKVTVPNSDGLSVFKDGKDYFVEYTGPYGSVQAKILQRNVRLTNGVIHVIDNVLYIDNAQAFNTVGASTALTPSILLLAACDKPGTNVAVWKTLSTTRKFADLLSTLPDVYDVLKNPNVSFTLLAPTNAAIAEIPEQSLNTLTANTETSKGLRKQALKYHFIRYYPENGEKAYQMLDFSDQVIQSDTVDGLRLFFRQLRRNGTLVQFVNGAALLKSFPASNGIIHIIDKFLHEVASTSSAYSYIYEQSTDRYLELRTAKFLDMLDASQNLMGTPYTDMSSPNTYVTVFAPTDFALQNLTSDRMGKLKSNKYQLVKLLRRHVISSSSGVDNVGVGAVYHASLLELRRQEALRTSGGLAEIQAIEGSIKPITVNKELYVTNTCGRVKVLMTAYFNRYSSRRLETTPVFANRTVHNGVVHLVDGLLGYIYNDAYDMIKEDKRVDAMENHISRAPASWADRLRLPVGTVLRAHQRITVFVPINDAFFRVERAKDMQHFSKNITYVQEVLNLHIVRGQHSLSDITASTNLPTLLADHTASFRWKSDELYVSVGHVQGRVVVPDVCVENGILHFVDTVLAVPYLTIFDYITDNYYLLNLYRYIRKSGAELVLKNVNQPVTMFAPNHEAFELMQETTVGRELLGNGGENENKLQQVIIGHTVRGYFYTDDMRSDVHSFPGSQLTLIKEGDEYYIERRGDYMTVRARVLQTNLRMTNGVLYVIDTVLYEDSQEAFRAIPVSATRGQHTTWGVVTSLLVSSCLVLVCLSWR